MNPSHTSPPPRTHIKPEISKMDFLCISWITIIFHSVYMPLNYICVIVSSVCLDESISEYIYYTVCFESSILQSAFCIHCVH